MNLFFLILFLQKQFFYSVLSLHPPEPLIPPVIRAKVGSRSTFNCSTPDKGTVDIILWLNSTGEAVAMATNSATAVLVLDPPSLSYDNMQYSCRMTNGIIATATIQLERKWREKQWAAFIRISPIGRILSLPNINYPARTCASRSYVVGVVYICMYVT